jgi:hypothetical protein
VPAQVQLCRAAPDVGALNPACLAGGDCDGSSGNGNEYPLTALRPADPPSNRTRYVRSSHWSRGGVAVIVAARDSLSHRLTREAEVGGGVRFRGYRQSIAQGTADGQRMPGVLGSRMR